MLCNTEDAEKIMEIIRSSAHTGAIGDGKIWVTEVARAMRIRTGEMGADAT